MRLGNLPLIATEVHHTEISANAGAAVHTNSPMAKLPPRLQPEIRDYEIATSHASLREFVGQYLYVYAVVIPPWRD